ncbi:MAG: 30S ribosomal protein S3 [Nanoarchaeota archaeon]|nr:30S ribosomal protein S3 [Nanoarchaeota archaeon]
MIERKFVAERIKEFHIQEYVRGSLNNAGLSHIKIQKTPLGEKIIVHTSRPGLVVGKKGQNIKNLTKALKKQFELENPQIEIAEVENLSINASIMAEKIANALERFGTRNFKGVGHKIMTEVMKSGALGIEIILSGKIPGSRAKSWRFFSGYLRKCGDVAIEQIDKANMAANLKSGVVGIKVSIMPPDIKLPDVIHLIEEKEEIVEEITEEKEKTEDSKKEKTEEKEEKEKKPKEKKKRTKKVKEEKDESKGNKVDE